MSLPFAGIKLRQRFGTKLDAICRHVIGLSQRGEKVLIFSQWTELFKIMATALRGNEIGFTSFDQDKKNAPVRFSTDPTISVFLLNVQKAAAGLTLTAATHVFMVEPLLNPGVEMQASTQVILGRQPLTRGTFSDG